jgi:phage terminase small subunit
LIKGALRPNRPNRRMAVLDPTLGPPEAPAFLTPEARHEWNRQAPALFKAGLLTRVDGAVLAAYCVSFVRWSEAELLLADRRQICWFLR